MQEYLLDPAEREHHRFISTNGRIEDPVRQLELEDLSKRWTDAERKHFHEQFMLFPKVIATTPAFPLQGCFCASVLAM